MLHTSTVASLAALLACGIGPATARAAKLPGVFSNEMVLQRERPVPV